MTTARLLSLCLLVPLSLAAQDVRPAVSEPGQAAAPAWQTLTRKLPDGVVMTADWFPLAAHDAARGTTEPRQAFGVALCLHQGAASRGEYRAIAPILNEIGLDVLVPDLRSGDRRFAVDNETAKSHVAARGSPARPLDAYGDVVFALRWARELSPTGPCIAFGSAQSAALAILAATREKDAIDALVLFSPGEFVEGTAVWEEAAKVTVPTYATCGIGSKESSWASGVVAGIKPELLTTFWPMRPVIALHGAPTLLAGDDKNRALQWSGVGALIERVRPK